MSTAQGVGGDGKADKSSGKGSNASGLLLFYFAASWCTSSHDFTPRLVEFCQKAKEERVRLCLVSLDMERRAMYDFMDEHGLDCLAVEPRTDMAGALIARFGVRTIPQVVVTTLEGRVLSDDGKGQIKQKGWNQCLEEWRAAGAR